MCSDCKMFMGDVQKELMDPNVQQTIISAVEQVCSLLGDLSSECQSLVEQYGSTVVNALAQILDPQNTCNTIGFCGTLPRLRVKAGDPCMDCKAFFNDTKMMLSNVTVQKEILNEIKQVCSLLGQYADQCTSLIDQYGPLAFDLLLPELDPSSICSTIGFCQGMDTQQMITAFIKVALKLKTLPTSDMCSDCKMFMGDVQKELMDPNVQQTIISAVEQVCSLLGDLSSECQSLVEQYGSTVISAVAQILDPQNTCNTIGFCGAVPRLRIKAGDPCMDCKAFFNDTKMMLSNVTVQKEILNEIKQVCSLLGQYADQCTSLIDQYGPLAFDLLLPELDPSTICSAIGYCQSMDVQQMITAVTRIAIKLKTFQLPTSDMCSDCKMFMGDVQKELMDPNVQQTIISAVEQVCSLLGDLSSECQSLVEQYGSTVINALAQVLDPQNTCGTIGFCSTSPKVQLPTSDMCSDCKMFMGDVQKELMDPNVQQTIISAVEQVCSLLGDLSSECQSLVEQYGSTVINAVAQILDPQNTCGTIGFCGTQLKLRVKSGDTCTDCKDFFGDIQNMLKDMNVQQKILQEVEKVCPLLPPTIAGPCKSYVQMYGILVVDFVIAELNPNTICTAIQYCSGTLDAELVTELIGKVFLQVRLLPTSDMCSDCKMFMGDVQKELMDPNVQQTIISAVEQVCSLLGDLSSECQSLVEQYGSTVINALAQILDPQNTCNTIGFCSAVPRMRSKASDICTDCKNFFTDVENVLKDPTVQSEILDDLEQVCSVLGAYSSQCTSAIQQYGPLVFTLLLSQVNPATICSAIQYCPSEVKPVIPNLLMASLSGGFKLGMQVDDECSDCSAFFGDVQNLFSNYTVRQMMIKDLDQICNLFADPLSCKQTIESDAPEVFDYLAQQITPIRKLEPCKDCQKFMTEVQEVMKGPKFQNPLDACTTIGFCPGKKKLLPQMSQILQTIMTNLAVDTCTNCEAFVGDTRKLIIDNQKQIISAVKDVCSLLGSLEEQCKSLVEGYGNMALEVIVNLMDPETLCKAIGYCSTNVQGPNPSERTSAQDILRQNMVAIAPSSDITTANTDSEVGNSTGCALCEFVIKELENQITKNSTEQEIINAVANVCNLLPGTLKLECEEFVTAFGPALISILMTELPPSKICTTLGLCTTSSEVADKSNAGPQCVLCEFVMRELDQLISENSTKEEIEAALKKVCSFLPTTIQAECKEYVDGYTAEILELLVEGLKPELVCSALGLCTPISDNQEPKLPAKVDAGNCALCEFIMKEIDSELTQNATEKEIVQLVENICTVLPSSLTAECDSFIETYGTVLINLLVQQLDPKEICTYLGQCSAATQVFKPKPGVGPVGANPEECALCEFIMKELDQLLSENATEEEIKMALDKVCSLLPKSLKTSCLVDVNKYTDIIIKLLLKGLDPSAVCRAIQLCDNNVAASNVAATADPDEDCVLCMDLMLALEDFLQSNRTEKEIYEDFVEACGGLGALANDCLTFVTKYGHEFPGLFDQLLAPLKVCEALKVCTCTTCKANENICSQGPTAWCKSMENAKLCNAVVHCQRHVWN